MFFTGLLVKTSSDCSYQVMPIKNNTKFVDTQAMTNSYNSLLLIAIVTHDVLPFQISSECGEKKSVLELMTHRKNFLTYRKLWTARKREEHFDNEKNTVLELDKVGFKSQSHVVCVTLGILLDLCEA